LPATHASVIVRAKNKEATIEGALSGLREQTVNLEIVVVDSGSTDATTTIARRYCDELVCIPPSAFTYGRALNIGARHAHGDVLLALSAHCLPSSRQWAEQHLEHYADADVAGVFGWVKDPYGKLLTSPTRFRFADLGPDPFWGFSNHASSWRRSVWEQLPFDEELPASEDKDWMWRALEAGYSVVSDPRTLVPVSHRRQVGVRAYYNRIHRERQATAELFYYPRYTVMDTLKAWMSDLPEGSPHATWMRLLSPWRTAEMIARYTGDRAGTRRQSARTRALPAPVVIDGQRQS
jgi:rhamnosyltransferase